MIFFNGAGAEQLNVTTYRFDGPISESSVSTALASLPANSTLVIRSGGGDEGPTVELAEAIFDRHIHVEVRGYCLSGCAVAVLAASGNLSIAPNVIFALHHSSVDIEQRLQALNETVPASTAQSAAGLRAVYRRAGVDPHILTCAAQQIGATLSRRWAVNPATHQTEQGWLNRRAWWVLRNDSLRHFGVIANFPDPSRPIPDWQNSVRPKMKPVNADDIVFDPAPPRCGDSPVWAQGPLGSG